MVSICICACIHLSIHTSTHIYIYIYVDRASASISNSKSPAVGATFRQEAWRENGEGFGCMAGRNTGLYKTPVYLFTQNNGLPRKLGVPVHTCIVPTQNRTFLYNPNRPHKHKDPTFWFEAQDNLLMVFWAIAP